MVNRVPFQLVWRSRHILHRKMTNGFYFFIILFLVFFNQFSKFLFTSKLYFSLPLTNVFPHFNFQQLSTLKPSFCFVFTSSFKNIIENENENGKIYFIRFYWISNTKVRFTLLNFYLERGMKIQRLISGGGGGDGFFFSKKISGGGRLFGTFE